VKVAKKLCYLRSGVKMVKGNEFLDEYARQLK
jgi:hypothetical protein